MAPKNDIPDWDAILRSERLVYRRIEASDQAFMGSLMKDPTGYLNRTNATPRAVGEPEIKKFCELIETGLLKTIMCIPGPHKDGSQEPSLIPIGFVCLFPMDPAEAHHRSTGVAIDISKEWRGKGYGREAIVWITRWAFIEAGLHRVHIAAYEWNPVAVHLYPSIGFREEARQKKALWRSGRWWDSFAWAMLREEWDELYGDGMVLKKKPVAVAK